MFMNDALLTSYHTKHEIHLISNHSPSYCYNFPLAPGSCVVHPNNTTARHKSPLYSPNVFPILGKAITLWISFIHVPYYTILRPFAHSHRWWIPWMLCKCHVLFLPHSDHTSRWQSSIPKPTLLWVTAHHFLSLKSESITHKKSSLSLCEGLCDIITSPHLTHTHIQTHSRLGPILKKKTVLSE